MVLTDISCGMEKHRIPIENDIDNSAPKEFEYIKTSIPSATLSIDDLEVEYCGCTCADQTPEQLCSHSSHCDCIRIKNCGVNNYEHRRFSFPDHHSTDNPVFECNDQCSCPADQCPNRVVQHGIQCRLSIFRSRRKGWCLKTLEPIPRGVFVCEYAGEILSYSEAKERTVAQSDEDNNYIHVLNEHLTSTGAVIRTYVDPTVCGNVGRFANHSCDPNLVMVPVRIDNAVPRLALFSKRDIGVNEELHFDYSGRQHGTQTNKLDASNSTFKRRPCLCHSPNCTNFLPFDDSLFNL